MRFNPYINAACAAAYIGAIGLLMQFISSLLHDTPDTLLDPIAFLSLLVFSVAVMAFLFFYKPVVLLLDNKKHEAVSYFLKTLMTFGAITVLMLTLVALMLR